MLKDEKLRWLLDRGCNVASFVSMANGEVRFHGIPGVPQGYRFASPDEAIRRLFAYVRGTVLNIRSFTETSPDGNPFRMEIGNVEEIIAQVKEYMEQGLIVIVNENVDINDGGFSGVLYGDLMEGAPGDTPRCVDKPGCMRLPRKIGFDLIRILYEFHFHMPFTKADRVEFSVHPFKVGYWSEPQIIWQADESSGAHWPSAPSIQWPNRMSDRMGDKVYGLLMAALHGFPVPRTLASPRRMPPFTFGTAIYSGEPKWWRTAPVRFSPGKFTTRRCVAWPDKYAIVSKEDPKGTDIAADFVQDGIRAEYSGAAALGPEGGYIIEGCVLQGDEFMTGDRPPESLPDVVRREVSFLFERLKETFGDCNFEWVFDGKQAWPVQLHLGRIESFQDVIFPGEAPEWMEFELPDKKGLEALREFLPQAKSRGVGLNLIGDVGLTGHIAQLLRGEKIPSRLIPKAK